MSDSIRARFSDDLELVTHVPIPAGEPETPIVYVVTEAEAWVGHTVSAAILDDGEIKSAEIELEAPPEDPSDVSGLTAYKIIKGVNNALFHCGDGWVEGLIIDMETTQPITSDNSGQYLTADLVAGKTYVAILTPGTSS